MDKWILIIRSQCGFDLSGFDCIDCIEKTTTTITATTLQPLYRRTCVSWYTPI